MPSSTSTFPSHTTQNHRDIQSENSQDEEHKATTASAKSVRKRPRVNTPKPAASGKQNPESIHRKTKEHKASTTSPASNQPGMPTLCSRNTQNGLRGNPLELSPTGGVRTMRASFPDNEMSFRDSMRPSGRSHPVRHRRGWPRGRR